MSSKRKIMCMQFGVEKLLVSEAYKVLFFHTITLDFLKYQYKRQLPSTLEMICVFPQSDHQRALILV